jgi:phytoene dehydrogenase-like protein
MRLHEHGLKVVLRKVDNFLPTIGGNYLLSGRGGLTRREIARHSPKDAESYDDYSAALESVVAIVRQWLLRAPPNAGGGLADILALLKLGNGVRGLSLEEQRHLLDFFTKSAGDILERYFSHELVQALFGFDAVVGNYASPYTPGSAYVLLHHLFGEAAGVPGAWGHAIGGMGAITEAMAKACREKGVEIVLEAPVEEVIVKDGKAAGVVAGGRTYRAAAVAANVHPKLLFEKLMPQGSVAPEIKRRMLGYASEVGDVPDEPGAVGAAAIHEPASGGRSSDRRHHHGAVTSLYGPRLSERPHGRLVARADHRDADPLYSRRQPGAAGAHVASLFCQHFPMKCPAAGKRGGRRLRSTSWRRSIAMAPGFKASVVGQLSLSPLDLEQRFGLVGGDIFHGKDGAGPALLRPADAWPCRLPDAAPRPLSLRVWRASGRRRNGSARPQRRQSYHRRPQPFPESQVKTRAAIATAPNKPLEIHELDLEGPRAGEVLVEIMATGHLPYRCLHAGGEGQRRYLPVDPRP